MWVAAYAHVIGFVIVTLLVVVYLWIIVWPHIHEIGEQSIDLDENGGIEEYNTQLEHIMRDLEYNDKMLFESNKYIYDIYKQNNNFEESRRKGFVKSNQHVSDQAHFNMTKNYDVLDKNSSYI